MSARYFEGASHAALYYAFRPTPPTYLLKRIINFLKEKVEEPLTCAVDVGCGSGQSTHALARYFENVTGVDVSQAQINQAQEHYNIKNMSFRVSQSESMPFESTSAQLMTAAQSAHWFDMPKFYKEADRILVPNGVLAIYGYSLPRPQWGDVTKELCDLVDKAYSETREFWGKERKDIDTCYRDPKYNIPYPEVIRDDSIACEQTYTVHDFQGYISTWSGFQEYTKHYGEAAGKKLLYEFTEKFMALLKVSTSPEKTKLVIRFPFFLIMARKP